MCKGQPLVCFLRAALPLIRHDSMEDPTLAPFCFGVAPSKSLEISLVIGYSPFFKGMPARTRRSS